MCSSDLFRFAGAFFAALRFAGAFLAAALRVVFFAGGTGTTFLWVCCLPGSVECTLRVQGILRTQFTADLKPAAAENFTPFDAAIWIVAPVCGLRPSRAARCDFWNEPKPGRATLSPAATASTTDPRAAVRMSSTSFFDLPRSEEHRLNSSHT